MPVTEITAAELAGNVREITEDEIQQDPGFFEGIGRQAVSGLDDVTKLLAYPFQATFGDVVIGGDEGIEFRGPGTPDPALGLPGRAEGDPKGMFEHAARFAGQTAAAGPVLGRLAGLVGPAAKVTPAATKLERMAQIPSRTGAALKGGAFQAGQTFAKAPVASTAIEAGYGATAGAGGYVGSQIVPDSDAAKFTGEILGGTLPAITPTAIAIRAAGGVKNLFHKMRHPFTTIGGAKRAQARASRAVPKGERISALEEVGKVTTIDRATGRPVLTPAQRTGAPGMLSLEKAIMESSEQLSREADAQIAHANRVIQASLEGIGQAHESTARVTLEDAHNHLDDLMDTRVRIAAQRVDERVAELGPKASREQANRVAREEIEAALSAARKQERELYALIPDDTPAPFSQTKDVFDRFRSELGVAQQSDIPPIAKRFLNEKAEKFFGKISKGLPDGTASIKDLRSLQGKLREIARNARAGDRRNLNMARIADDIADAITEDLANTLGGPEVADAISTAVTFSRNLHDRFSKGATGKVLGKRVTGEPRVPASLTLEESIGVTGPKAREAMDGLVKAFDNPEASGVLVGAAEDFIRSKFLTAAVERGALNTSAARRFLKQNQEILGRLPELQRQIQGAIDVGDALALKQRQRSRVSLDDPRVSKATMLIQKGPVEAFRQISRLNPAQAAKEAQQLVNRTVRDGEAIEGLKSGFIEFLLSGARTSKRDAAGHPFVSGFALRDAIKDPSTRAMVGRILSQEEKRRLGIITRDLIKLEKRQAARMPIEGVIGDTPNKLVEAVAGITGAAVGRSQAARLGVGGTVQIPGIIASRFRALVNAGVKDPAGRLLRDSVADEDLFKELLQEPLLEEGTKLTKRATRRLNIWFAVVMAENGGSAEE